MTTKTSLSRFKPSLVPSYTLKPNTSAPKLHTNRIDMDQHTTFWYLSHIRKNFIYAHAEESYGDFIYIHPFLCMRAAKALARLCSPYLFNCWFTLYRWSVMEKQVTSTPPPPPNTWKWGGGGFWLPVFTLLKKPVDREPAINVDMVNGCTG